MAALLLVLVAVFLTPASLFLAAPPVQAEAPISVLRLEAESRAPNAVLVRAEISAPATVTEVTLHVRTGSSGGTMLVRPDFTPGTTVAIEAEIPTGGVRYIPPGADLAIQVEARDTAGNVVMSEPVRLTYLDRQFEWKTATARDGLITAYYYGDALERARRALRGAEAALDRMQEKAGVVVDQPFRLVIFTSADGWQAALPPARSRTFEQQIGYAGLAYGEHDVVMMQATRPSGLDFVESVAAHEVTHLVVHRAAGNNVAAWLNEGLAVYGEPQSGPGQDGQVRRAAESNRLLLTRAIQTQPGQPGQVGLFYAQGYSLVKFLLERYPPDRMQGLLAALRGHESLDRALQQHYGFDQDGLDAAWRAHVGAPPREYTSAIPTPVAPPNVELLTRPPQAGGSEVEREGGGPEAARTEPPLALVGGALIVLGLAGGAVLALRGRRAG